MISMRQYDNAAIRQFENTTMKTKEMNFNKF
jgi:hypothetical protein